MQKLILSHLKTKKPKKPHLPSCIHFKHHFTKEENHKFIRLEVKHRLPLVPHIRLQWIQQLISITHNLKSCYTLHYSPLHLLLQLLFIFRAKSTVVLEKPSSLIEELILIWALGLLYKRLLDWKRRAYLLPSNPRHPAIYAHLWEPKMLKLKLQYFGHLMRRVDSLEKTLMLGGIGGRRRRGTTEDEMAGWHHWLYGRESEWPPGADDGQGGLACCDS